jgi:hypothetical protein
MASCPRCERDGRLQEIAVLLTRWGDSGTETTRRCPRCDWQEVTADHTAHPPDQRDA